MTRNLIKFLGLLSVVMIFICGCGDEKTTVTEVKKQKVEKNIEPVQTVKIKTH